MGVDVDSLPAMDQDLQEQLEGIMRQTVSMMGRGYAMQKLTLGALQQMVQVCKQRDYPIEELLK